MNSRPAARKHRVPWMWVFLCLVGTALLLLQRSCPGLVSPPETIQSSQPHHDASKPVAGAAAKFAQRHPLARAEAISLLRAYYLKEELAEELAVGQARYAKNYWNADAAGPELRELERTQARYLATLDEDMNAALREACAGEQGPPVALPRLFNDGRVAPNLAFLVPQSRQAFEANLLAAILAADGNLDPQMLQRSASSSLNPAELAQFDLWNGPGADPLRNRLAEFAASEDEFDAVRAWTDATSVDGPADPAAVAAETLVQERLGEGRFKALQEVLDPAEQTAAQDLRRWGMSVADAAWLAGVRSEGTREIQATWNDSTVPGSLKEIRVASIQAAYRQKIAARLTPNGLTPSDIDFIP